MQVLKAGALYFGVVFGTGFVLGTIRTLWVVPRFGASMAELMEMPIMLVVTGMGSDDWHTAIRNATIGSTHRQSGSTFMASGVNRTETLLGFIVLNFQVVSDCLTAVPVANHHLIKRMLQMEELHAAW